MQEYGKVLAYVVRERASGEAELLVFTHRDHPEAGLQVPAGTIDDGESPEAAVLRELAEESGLTGLPIIKLIDRYTWIHPATGNRHHRNVFQFNVGREVPAAWEHVASGSAEEDGLVFSLRWMPVVDAQSQLTADQGRSLHLLARTDRVNKICIRLATQADLVVINDIYNHYVLQSTCTYQENPEPIESRRAWFEKHGEKHPITVATIDGQLVGWGSLSPYHARSAYRFTVENSVYVHHDFHCRGIGSMLLRDLIERARALGHRAIIAGIDGEQSPSMALHARFGFTHVGCLKQVGFKFGRWLDVIYMQLLL